MRILLTTHQFLPEFSWGTETLTLKVAEELLHRGHEVAVLTGHPALPGYENVARCDEYVLGQLPVFRICYSNPSARAAIAETYRNPEAMEFCRTVLERFRPDVVHFFHFLRLGAGLVDVVRERGIPAFFTPTDFWSICPLTQMSLPDGDICSGPTEQGGNCVRHLADVASGQHWMRPVPVPVLDKWIWLTRHKLAPPYPFRGKVMAIAQRKAYIISRLNMLNHIFAPTRMLRERLIAHGVDELRISIMPYGLDLRPFGADIAAPAPGAVVTFGFIGSLVPHKGCQVLIDAFKGLPPGSARLKIYGNPDDGPEYSAGLMRSAAECEDIEFCGTFPNERIAQVLSGMDALVVPSQWIENGPLVVYSAQAAKRPVIASDYPGLSEAIRDGYDGLLFTPGDVGALRHRLSQVLADRQLLNRLGENCRRPKSIVTYVDELLAAYCSVPQTALL